MGNSLTKCLSWFLLILGAAVLVIAVTMSWPALKQKRATQHRLDQLTEEYARKNSECMRLAREIHDLEHSASAAEKVAREKFNCCREGEVILRYDR